MESGELQIGASVLSKKERAQFDRQTAKLFKLVVDRNGICVVGRKDKKATVLFIPDSYKGKPITSIANNAFYACANLENVYYQGTESEWNKIDVSSNNWKLKHMTKYFYSENLPTKKGNYWRYVNGVPTAW